MIKKSVGIYVNKNIFQFVVLNKTFNKVKLLAAESIKIPQGEVISSVNMSAKPIDLLTGKAYKKVAAGENEPKEKIKKILTPFESAVKEVLRYHGIKEGQIVSAAIPPEHVVVRYFHMSRLSPQEHKTAIPFEACKYLPYKLEDIIYAYTISYDKVASNKMAVTFVAADKNFMANYVRFFENLGLRIGYLEAVPYSLIRFLYHTKDADFPQTIALINVIHDSANINLVRNKVLYLTRNLSFPGKSPQAAIEDQDTAVDLKFDNLLSEIRLSFDYFHRQFPEEKIEKMIVWSDDVRIQEKAQNLGKDLNIYTKTVNPFGYIEKGGGYSVEYSISAGLALRVLYQSYQGINLSVGIKKIEIEKLLKVVTVQLCLAAALLFIFNLADSRKIKSLQNDLKNILVENSISMTEPGSIIVEKIQNEKSLAKEKFDYLKNLTAKKFSINSKIARVGSLLPEGLWIDKMEYSGLKSRNAESKLAFLIKGYVCRLKGDDQIKSINKFVEDLKKDGIFSSGFVEIKLDSILNERYEDVAVTSFQVVCLTE